MPSVALWVCIEESLHYKLETWSLKDVERFLGKEAKKNDDINCMMGNTGSLNFWSIIKLRSILKILSMSPPNIWKCITQSLEYLIK